MASNIVAFRHTTHDGLGSLENVIKNKARSFQYIDTFREDFSDFDPLFEGLLVVLGGAPGAYQADIYPFLQQEMDILEKRLAADLPTLGICLGSQLMAKTLGADVYPGEQGPEIGWYGININDNGKDTAVRHLDGSATQMLHWHGDTFDLPQGATLLASSDKYKNQIYSYGKNALALQCHPEVDLLTLQNWMVGAAGNAAKGKLDIPAIRSDTERHVDTLMNQTAKFFGEWLEQVVPE